MARTSMSLPDGVLSDLKYLSGRMGMSKSALMTEILGDALSDLRVLFETLPDEPSKVTEKNLIRFRGASAQLVKDRIQQARDLADGDDLFNDM